MGVLYFIVSGAHIFVHIQHNTNLGAQLVPGVARQGASLVDVAFYFYQITYIHFFSAPSAGLEPAIYGLEVRCIIHYATRA